MFFFCVCRFSKHNLGLGIPVYLMIFITSQVFQVFTAWDAVRRLTLHNNNTINTSIGPCTEYNTGHCIFIIQSMLLCICCFPIQANGRCINVQ